MKKLLFVGLLLFLLVSCEKNNIEKDLVKGIWVESTHKTDTLIFDKCDLTFELKRGTELRNGSLLPKYFSGTYTYEIGNDSISLLWMYSSCSISTNYYFELDSENDEIKIGNFFIDSLNNAETLTFLRVK